MSTESTEIKLTDSELKEASEAYKNVINIEAEPVEKYIDEINNIDAAVNAKFDAELKKGGKVTKKSKVKSRSRSRSKSKIRSKSKSKSKR
jgi:hypothetical protein